MVKTQMSADVHTAQQSADRPGAILPRAEIRLGDDGARSDRAAFPGGPDDLLQPVEDRSVVRPPRRGPGDREGPATDGFAVDRRALGGEELDQGLAFAPREPSVVKRAGEPFVEFFQLHGEDLPGLQLNHMANPMNSPLKTRLIRPQVSGELSSPASR